MNSQTTDKPSVIMPPIQVASLESEAYAELARRITALEDSTLFEKRLGMVDQTISVVKQDLISIETKVTALTGRMDRSEELHNDHKHVLEEIHGVLTEMKELLKTWNSVKSTMGLTKSLGDALVWLVKAAGAAALVWAAFKFALGTTPIPPVH